MTLYQLKVFLTAAKLGSFTQAADVLRVRQPSVSLIIQGLQLELDVKLFERLGNKIRLTNAGEELLKEAESVVTRADGIKERMEEVKGLKKGKISLGSSGIATSSFLPLAIEAFKKEHPGIGVFLKVERSFILEKKLLNGEIDLAALGQAPRSPLLVGELYREEEILVVASPKHPLTRKRSVPLKIIAKEPLITHEKGTIIRDTVEQSFIERNLPFTPILEVNLQLASRDALKSVIASGVGIGFQAKCHLIPDIKSGRLKVLRVPELKLKRTVYIAVHKKRQSSSLVQAFIKFLKQYSE